MTQTSGLSLSVNARMITAFASTALVSSVVASFGAYYLLKRYVLDNTNVNKKLPSKKPKEDATVSCSTVTHVCYNCSDSKDLVRGLNIKEKRKDPHDPHPRENALSWDDYFMALAFLSAERSKDPNKQVGACIVNERNIIVATGYNGFPRGCPDSDLPWAKLPPPSTAASASAEEALLLTKYPYVVHAEANALTNKNAASVVGARIYVTMFPCNECAKLLIQAGVSEVIYHEAKVHRESEPLSRGRRVARGARVPILEQEADAAEANEDVSLGEAAPLLPAAAKDTTSSSGGEVMYRASLRMLDMAGVKLRQYKLSHALIIPPPPPAKKGKEKAAGSAE